MKLTLGYYRDLHNLKRSRVSKKVERRLYLELKDKLAVLLHNNDRCCIEVDANVAVEFLNILSTLRLYDYVQISATEFEFTNKEIRL